MSGEQSGESVNPALAEARRPFTQAAVMIADTLRVATPTRRVLPRLSKLLGIEPKPNIVYAPIGAPEITVVTDHRDKRLPRRGLRENEGNEIYYTASDIQALLDRLGGNYIDTDEKTGTERDAALYVHRIIQSCEEVRDLPWMSARQIERTITTLALDKKTQQTIVEEHPRDGSHIRIFFPYNPQSSSLDAKMIEVVTDKTRDNLSSEDITNARNLATNRYVAQALREMSFHAVTLREGLDYTGKYVTITDPKGREKQVYLEELAPLPDKRAMIMAVVARDLIRSDPEFRDLRPRRLKELSVGRVCDLANLLQKKVIQEFLDSEEFSGREQSLSLRGIDSGLVSSYIEFIGDSDVLVLERHGKQVQPAVNHTVVDESEIKAGLMSEENNKEDPAEAHSLGEAIALGVISAYLGEVDIETTYNPRGYWVAYLQNAVIQELVRKSPGLRIRRKLACINYKEYEDYATELRPYLTNTGAVEFTRPAIDGATGIDGTFDEINRSMKEVLEDAFSRRRRRHRGRPKRRKEITHTQQIAAGEIAARNVSPESDEFTEIGRKRLGELERVAFKGSLGNLEIWTGSTLFGGEPITVTSGRT